MTTTMTSALTSARAQRPSSRRSQRVRVIRSRRRDIALCRRRVLIALAAAAVAAAADGHGVGCAHLIKLALCVCRWSVGGRVSSNYATHMDSLNNIRSVVVNLNRRSTRATRSARSVRLCPGRVDLCEGACGAHLFGATVASDWRRSTDWTIDFWLRLTPIVAPNLSLLTRNWTRSFHRPHMVASRRVGRIAIGLRKGCALKRRNQCDD